jgi:hypothetical protein
MRLWRSGDLKCDACEKYFSLPTLSGDGVRVIAIGATLVANTVWIAIRVGLSSLFSPSAAIIAGMILLGLALVAMGIWNLLRCIQKENGASWGFDVLPKPSDFPKAPQDLDD